MGLNMQLFTHFAIHHRTFFMSMFPNYPMNGKSNKKCGAENKLWFLNQMKHHADHLKNKSPFFNQVGLLRTSSHLQLRPGQDKAKQFDTYNNTELHME